MKKIFLFLGFCSLVGGSAFYTGWYYAIRNVLERVEFTAEEPNFTPEKREMMRVLYSSAMDSLKEPEKYYLYDVEFDSINVCLIFAHLSFFKQVHIKGTSEAIIRKDDSPEVCFKRKNSLLQKMFDSKTSDS